VRAGMGMLVVVALGWRVALNSGVAA